MNQLRRMIHSQGNGRWEDIGARTLTHVLETLEPGMRHRIVARSVDNKTDITAVLVVPGSKPRQVDQAVSWREEWLGQS